MTGLNPLSGWHSTIGPAPARSRPRAVGAFRLRGICRALALVFLWLPWLLSACAPGTPPTPIPVTPIPATPMPVQPTATLPIATSTMPPATMPIVPTTSVTPSPSIPTLTPIPTATRTLPATVARAATPTVPATVTASPTRVGSTRSAELVSALGAPYGAAVSVVGEYLYLGVGTRFVVLDISHPEQPIQVGQSALLSSYLNSITIRNDYAFVTTASSGVSVFNLSNVRQPKWVATLPEIKAQGLIFSGDLAYGVDDTGFQIYRLLDPMHWTKLSALVYDGMNKHVAVVGSYAYVTGAGLHVVDVSDPARPREIGVYTGMQSATDLTILGDYAWVLTGYLLRGRAFYGELHVVDIRNPAKPTRVEMIPFDQPTQRLYVANGFAYVGTYWDLHVLNAADPRAPKPVSTYRNDGITFGLANIGQLLMIASADGDALRIVNIAHPEQLRQVGAFYTPKHAKRLAIREGAALFEGGALANAASVGDRYAYVADTRYGFLVMDVADPAAPVVVGRAPEPFEAWDIAVSGEYVYVSALDGLRIFKLVTPARPVAVGAIPLPLNSRSRLSLAGARAYVTGGKAFVVDITHPDAPQLMSTLAFSEGQADDLAISGHYALIAVGDALRIFDVADSTRPVEVGSLRWSDRPSTVRTAGDYAYVVSYQSGLHIVNIANVTKPEQVAFLATGNVRDLALAGTLAWLADDQVGVYAVDVTRPNDPVRVDALTAKGSTDSVMVAGDYIYAVQSDGGIAIWRVRQ